MPSRCRATAPDPLAPCSVQYTSGTTSRPKGVLWTHANALWGARINALHEDLRPEDVHLVHLPLFHTNAQAYSVLACLWAGATAVVMPRFSASRFWARVAGAALHLDLAGALLRQGADGAGGAGAPLPAVGQRHQRAADRRALSASRPSAGGA